MTVDLTPRDADEARGQRLDKYLVTRAAEADTAVSGLTRSRLQKLIEDGHVTVDGKAGRASLKLTGRERVMLTLPPPEPLEVEPESIALEVLHEDADVIVIVKPQDMVVHPGSGRRRGTLVNALLAHCRDLSGIGGVTRPGIVHRLDRGTSGVLVVAKNDRAHESLAGQFARREVEKRYTAFVLGTPVPATARISTFYGRHPTQRLRFTSKLTSGKKALTDYRVVRSAGGVSELDVTLGTGRTHQIRVHLSDKGHPVVGDALYGGRAYGRVTDPALRALCSALDHQALHARVLAFDQPTTGERLTLEAPLPADLAALTACLQETTRPQKNR